VAYGFSVYRLSDREFMRSPPSLEDETAFSAWEQECDARLLLDGALASVGNLDRYWVGPALELRLPVISKFADIFDSGLDVEGADLGGFREELGRLEQWWVGNVSDEDLITYSIIGRQVPVPVLADLVSRSEMLLQAVRVAERSSGFISFT
jgi:hypothetical protein